MNASAFKLLDEFAVESGAFERIDQGTVIKLRSAGFKLNDCLLVAEIDCDCLYSWRIL